MLENLPQATAPAEAATCHRGREQMTDPRLPEHGVRHDPGVLSPARTFPVPSCPQKTNR